MSTAEITDAQRATGFEDSSKSTLLLRVVLSVLTVQAAYSWCVTALSAFTSGQGIYDFSIYYAAGLALRDDRYAHIFDPNVLRIAAQSHHAFLMPVATLYLYPPLLAILMIPLTAFSFVTAAHIWAGINLLLWLVSTVLLIALFKDIARLAGTRTDHGMGDIPRHKQGMRPTLRGAKGFLRRIQDVPDGEFFAVAFVLYLSLTNGPLEESLVTGQVSLLIFFLVILAIWLDRRGHSGLAGVALACAALLKVFPIVLIGYFLLRRNWRVVGGAVIGGALLIVGMALYIGLAGVIATRSILANGTSSGLQNQNEALARIPFWLGVLAGRTPQNAPSSVGYVFIALIAVLFVGGVLRMNFWFSAQGAVRQHPATEMLGYAWALATMVLISPVTWVHHFAWLLPSFLLCLGYLLLLLRDSTVRDTQLTRQAVLIFAALIVGYILIARDLPFGYDSRAPFDPSPYFIHHIPARPFFMLQRPIGVLLIWVSAGALFLQGMGVRRVPQAQQDQHMEAKR